MNHSTEAFETDSYYIGLWPADKTMLNVAGADESALLTANPLANPPLGMGRRVLPLQGARCQIGLPGATTGLGRHLAGFRAQPAVTGLREDFAACGLCAPHGTKWLSKTKANI